MRALLGLLWPLAAFAGDFEAGLKLMERGDVSGAKARFEAVLVDDADDEKARYQLAVAHYLLDQDDKALLELARIQKDPETVRAVPLLKGELLLRKKNFLEALLVWAGFPDYNPDLRALREQGLARAYEGMGEHAKAADSWTRYLELQVKPTNDVLQKLAENRVLAGQKQMALAYCSSATLFQKQGSYRPLCSAHVHAAAKEKRAAVDALKESLRLDRENFDSSSLLRELK